MTTAGPIPLTVVTLWCRTAGQQCQKLIVTRSRGMCEEEPGIVYRGSVTGPIKAPPWCPLAKKEPTNA